MSYWDQRRHRDGGDGRSERFESARQRTIILTFATPDEANAWDEAGQPLSVDEIAAELADHDDDIGDELADREERP